MLSCNRCIASPCVSPAILTPFIPLNCHSVPRCCADYLLKVAVENRQSTSTRVVDVMTPKANLKMVSPNDHVLTAMYMMSDHNVRHVPVMNNEVRPPLLIH